MGKPVELLLDRTAGPELQLSSSTPKPLCTFEKVSRWFGSTRAVDGCSFTLNAGEVTALVGPNGAGKTTLARLLGGFVLPSDGRITILGMSPAEFRHQHGVGYLQAQTAAFPRMTVAQLLALKGREAEPFTPPSLAALLGIDGFLNRRLSALSTGQHRLAMIAYALLGGSPLVILDEPDAGLDVVALDRLHQLVRLRAEQGAAVVILSHQLHMLEEMCDRLVFIQSGRVHGHFSREEVRTHGAAELYRKMVTT